jgi:hypothetical protein
MKEMSLMELAAKTGHEITGLQKRMVKGDMRLTVKVDGRQMLATDARELLEGQYADFLRKEGMTCNYLAQFSGAKEAEKTIRSIKRLSKYAETDPEKISAQLKEMITPDEIKRRLIESEGHCVHVNSNAALIELAKQKGYTARNFRMICDLIDPAGVWHTYTEEEARSFLEILPDKPQETGTK